MRPVWIPPKPGSPPPQSALQLNLSDQPIRDLLSLDFLEYFEAEDPELPACTRLYLAAAAFHGILGINLSAWDEEVRVMGGALAALLDDLLRQLWNGERKSCHR